LCRRRIRNFNRIVQLSVFGHLVEPETLDVHRIEQINDSVNLYINIKICCSTGRTCTPAIATVTTATVAATAAVATVGILASFAAVTGIGATHGHTAQPAGAGRASAHGSTVATVATTATGTSGSSRSITHTNLTHFQHEVGIPAIGQEMGNFSLIH
jgi:hypothetical protein